VRGGSNIVRICTGVGQTPGFSEVIDGPTRDTWNSLSQEERQEYLDSVRLATLQNGVDSWAEVVEADA
jgi:hypothetical protein